MIKHSIEAINNKNAFLLFIASIECLIIVKYDPVYKIKAYPEGKGVDSTLKFKTAGKRKQTLSCN